ncbi:hypothetical protein [Armatimonas sp.]|uniref:hypothetical protein n=1 Tax=Armatimonas sp. TaxID=1872638 RepID=UPI003750B17D
MKKKIGVIVSVLVGGMILALYGCGSGGKLNLGSIIWTADGTDDNRSEGYISSTATSTFISGKLKDGGRVAIAVSPINGVGIFEPDEVLYENGNYVTYDDSVSRSVKEKLSNVIADITSYESNGKTANIKGTVKGKKKSSSGKIIDIVGEIDAVDIGASLVSGGTGGGSYKGSYSSQVSYLVAKLTAADIYFKYPKNASDTTLVAPDTSGLAKPCIRDAYVASAMAKAWGAEASARIGSSNATTYASSMMEDLRSAAELCGPAPTVDGTKPCRTNVYVDCTWLKNNTKSGKSVDVNRPVMQDTAINKVLKSIISDIIQARLQKSGSDTCTDILKFSHTVTRQDLR